MSGRRARALWSRLGATALFVVAVGAAAQRTPTHDPNQYPALASLVSWLRSDDQQARNCAATVAATLTARDAYEKSRSEAMAIRTIERGLVQRSGGRASPDQLRRAASGYVRWAIVFLPLPREAAGMAIAQLCRSAVQRGDRPFANEALLKRLAEEARACTSIGFVDKAANPVPLECVVKTVERRP